MKEITLADLAANLKGFLDAAQKEAVLIMRDGRRLAVIVGLEKYDDEDWVYMTSRAFWQLIEERRKRPSLPLDDLKAEFLADGA